MAGTACDAPAAYRPRRADERFAERYGFWRAEIERTLWAFLDCGIEEHGFARVRCDECRREWARLIARVFEVDPLRCPCGGAMRVVAFILDPAVIRKILQHRPRTEPRAHAPPTG